MHRSLLVLVVGGLFASAGCATSRGGVESLLPEPVMIRRQVQPLRSPVASTWRPTARPRRSYPSTPGLPRGVDLPGGIRRDWRYIVIHHSASESGSARQFDRYHRTVRGWNELGYHFVVGNGRGSGDGQIEVGPRWWKQKHGAHCKTPDNRFNDYGIGICLVGNFEDGGYPTASQMRSLSTLVRHLSRACGIAPPNIYAHGSVTHKTACPGRNFSLQQLKMSLSSVAYR